MSKADKCADCGHASFSHWGNAPVKIEPPYHNGEYCWCQGCKCKGYKKKEENKMTEHKHEWVYYDGALGYESYVCKICGIDQNDLRAKLTLKQLETLQVEK